MSSSGPPILDATARATIVASGGRGVVFGGAMGGKCNLRSGMIPGAHPTLCSVNWNPNELGSFLKRIVLKEESSSYIGFRDGDSVELGKGESQGSV